MKPEDIIRLIKEGGYDAVEGLGYLESLGKNLTIAGQAMQSASKDMKGLIEVAGKISKKMTQHKS